MTPEPATVIVQRVLPAPPEVVYDDWLDADGMLEWMCPRPNRPTKIGLEPWAGGRFCLDIDAQGCLTQITGTYRELDRPHRISLTWRPCVWEEWDRDSVVTVTLDPLGGAQTLMTIRHVLPSEKYELCDLGWAAIARQLDDTLLTRY